MTFGDVWLLTKKILVGIVITVVPLAVIAGALWMTQRLVGNHAQSNHTSSAKVTYAN
jgi:hypothetical protein